MLLGLLLALASALATNLAFLFKYPGAVVVAPIRVRYPLRSAAALFRSKWFAIGWLVAILAWVLHVGALALAPLSIVQAVLSGGLVFLAVLAERFFDFRLGRWQWFGVLITASGLVVIGLTGDGAARPQRSSLAALIAVEAAIFAIGAALLTISAHRRVLHRAEGLLLGLAAGALFGVSDIAIKYLTHAEGPYLGFLSPWTLTALVAGVIAFYASARSLQLGPPVEVIALTSVAANLAHPRRHPRLRRTDRLRPTPDRRPLDRLLPRHHRRSAHADSRRATRAERERNTMRAHECGPDPYD
jgi:drug/metabolite transporter (DMT)-like permease